MEIILALLLAGAAFATAWFIRKPQGDGLAQARADDLQRQLAAARAETDAERTAHRLAAAEAARGAAAAQAAREALATAETRHAADIAAADRRRSEEIAAMRDAFAKQSQEVLRAMAPDVSEQVKSRMEPLMAEVRTSLASVSQSVRTGLTQQGDALAGVRERLEGLNAATQALATETNDFTMVLKSAAHRGRWGEQTLRRVVEAAGMSPHCDFAEQVSEDDKRPDLVVKLPGNRCVIIDSKVPELDAARLAAGATGRAEALREHAQKLRATIRALAARNYPSAIGKDAGLVAYDKVILFLPAESLLSTALEADNNLVLEAGDAGVLLATPATLIGFLGAINLAWKEQAQADNARQIADAAGVLYERVNTFVEHFARVGKGLNAAADAFNKATASYQTRLRPAGDKLLGLGVGGADAALPDVERAEDDVRQPSEREG